MDQTVGILQALIEQPEVHDAANIAVSNAQQGHYWAFVVSLCLWSFVNYQATRLLHQYDYNSPEYAGRLSDRDGWLGWMFRQLEWLSPILMGLGPAFAVTLGFLVLQQRYSVARQGLSPLEKIPLYLPCAIIAALVFWRPFRGSKAKRKKPSQRRPLNAVLSKGDFWLAWSLLGLIIGLVAFTYCAPEKWALFGPAAVLCLAATVFVAFGSLLVFWGGRWRIPLVFLALLYCIIISPWNDNHSVRVTRDATKPIIQGDGIRDRLQVWIDRLSVTEPNKRPGQKTPLFIVCAEGGGVRAAYWTARLLAYLEDTTRRYPDQYVPFSSRVLAISAVSGGSLGAATFDALLDAHVDDPNADENWFFNRSSNFLGRDYLSAPLAASTFIDTTQRFIPYPIFDQRDRAAGLEKAWESAWKKSLESANGDIRRFCQFDGDFRLLWRYRDGTDGRDKSLKTWIPSLFFNGTSVQLGGRIIVSDCLIPAGDYPGAQDALCLLKLRNSSLGKTEPGVLRLSSAVNISTRFPGISPSGELPAPDGQFAQRVVDGGYYDNSGARTAWDNLVPIYYKLLERTNTPDHASDIVPWVIVIRSGPASKRVTPFLPSHPPQGWNFLPSQVRPVPGHFMVDVLAPARAFLHAWGARSGDSAEALKDGTLLISRRLAAQEGQPESPTELERVDYSAGNREPLVNSKSPDPYVIELNLELDEQDLTSGDPDRRRKLLLPLGWMLPARAREVIEKELADFLAPPVDLLKETKVDREWFRKMQRSQLGRVLCLLHRQRPVKP